MLNCFAIPLSKHNTGSNMHGDLMTISSWFPDETEYQKFSGWW